MHIFEFHAWFFNPQHRKHGMRLFVSHGPDGSDFAELLKMRLEEAGHKVWLDSETLGPGEDWQEEIERNIRRSDALIFVASPHAVGSEYANFEWAFALGAGVRVIPVLLARTRLHPRLQVLQSLDFTNHTSRPWSRLLNAVAGAFGDRDSEPERTPKLRPLGRARVEGDLSQSTEREVIAPVSSL